MLSEQQIKNLLKKKEIERKKYNANFRKAGNKGYMVPYLAVECGLLREILELKPQVKVNENV